MTSTVPILLSGTTWQLFAANPALLKKTNVILYYDTVECFKLFNALHIPVRTNNARGAYQLIDLAQSLLRKQSKLHIIISDHANIAMAINLANQTQIGLWHCQAQAQAKQFDHYYLGVAAAMLAYPLRNIDDNYCERLLDGAYLLQNSLTHERAVITSLRRIYDSLTV